MVLLPNYTIEKENLLKYENISKNVFYWNIKALVKTFKILSYVQDEVKYKEAYINRKDSKKFDNLYIYLFHFYKTRNLQFVSQTVQESWNWK